MITPTFEEVTKLWYDDEIIGICYSHENALKGTLKNLNSFLGIRKITEIEPKDINYVVTALARKNPNTNKPTAKKTLQLIIRTAYRIFDYAIYHDWITKNPAKNKMKAIPKYAPKKKVNAITKEERLLIEDTEHRCQTAALIMMYMGLRRGELIALKWSDFNFGNKTAYISHHAVLVDSNHFEVYSGTKTGNSRYVAIPDILINKLKYEKDNSESEYVFSKKDGTMHTASSFDSAWKSFNNALNYAYYIKCGGDTNQFDPKGYPKPISIKCHQLRHTYATLLYLSKTDMFLASKLMGHASVQITLDIYTDLDNKYQALSIKNLNSFLSKAI